MARHTSHWTLADYYALLARQHQAADAVLGGVGLDMPEKAMLARLRRLAHQAGLRCYHTWRSKRSEEGFPDVLIVDTRAVPPRLYCLELKTATGEVTLAQQAWIAALAQVPGVVARVVRPQDLGAIEGWLRDEEAESR